MTISHPPTLPPGGGGSGPNAPTDALERLGIARQFVEELSDDAGGVASIDRQQLVQLGEAADESMDHTELIRLFVAMMMWGSGTTNGRGPWRTRQSLESDQLVDVLHGTYACAQSGDLAEAHRAFKVTGVGESFLTKWFWVATLSNRSEYRALILDRRVRSTRWLLQPKANRIAPRGGHGYKAYVDAVHQIADRLVEPVFAGVDAEKLECLLFDRRIDRTEPGQMDLHGWLSDQ